MLDRCVVYGSFGLLRMLAAMSHARMAMPEAVSVEALRRSLAEMQPSVVAFDRYDFRDEVIAVARQTGVGILVDRLGSEDTEAHWEDAIRREATGIQPGRRNCRGIWPGSDAGERRRRYGAGAFSGLAGAA